MVPGSVLPGSRLGPIGSVDDTVIASLIFNSPSHPSATSHSSNAGGGLQKSPLHKSTSALTDLQESARVVPTSTTPGGGAHVNYQGHPHLAPHNSREYHNRSMPHRSSDDMFSPPPLTPVSAGHSATPHNHGGLPEFDLTDEIFQHFSGRSRRDVTPPTSSRHDYHLPPQQTSGPELRSHFPLHPNSSSSPIKRNLSPDVGASHHHYGDQRARSNSPDVYLPAPEHYRYRQQQQPSMAHSYTNSYHSGGTPSRNAHSNPPSRSGSSAKASNYRSGMTGASPHPPSVTSPPWYDGTSHQHHQQHHTHHHKPTTETIRSSHREEGGAYRQGQQHQHSANKSAAVPMPRRRNEETAEIQEFLHDLAKRETNPFNDGGTLV